MKNYHFECWNVAYRVHHHDITSNSEKFIAIKNPVLYWAADPFIVFFGDKYFIFAELYNRISYKGKIMYCILDEKTGEISPWKTALKKESHLSFPNVWNDGNNFFYMMPESSHSGNIVVYYANRFPDKWEPVETIITGERFADTINLNDNIKITYDNYSLPKQLVFLRKKDKYWGITSKQNDNNLVLRPAGKIFRLDKSMVIPLQDCNVEYGREIRFCTINDSGFISEPFFKLTPNNVSVEGIRNICVGMHTYNFDNGIEVIDVKTRKFNFLSLVGYVLKKIRVAII